MGKRLLVVAIVRGEDGRRWLGLPEGLVALAVAATQATKQRSITGLVVASGGGATKGRSG